jgi:hypothetical protein
LSKEELLVLKEEKLVELLELMGEVMALRVLVVESKE